MQCLLGLQAESVLGDTLAVPTAAQMVRTAGIVAEGNLRIDGMDVVFEPMDAIKGKLANDRIVMSSAYTSVVSFDLKSYVAKLRSKRCIILGRDPGDGRTVDIPWLTASIWPQGYDRREFNGNSVESCRDFIETVLSYESRLNKDPEKAADYLVREFEKADKRPMVLGFIDAFLPVGPVEPSLRRSLLQTVAGVAVTETNVDGYTARNFATLAPEIPASLGLRLFVDQAAKGDPVVRQEAFTQGKAILRARKLISHDECKTVNDLKIAAARHQTALARPDAEKALALFDSSVPSIRNSANMVMRAIFDSLSRFSPETNRFKYLSGYDGVDKAFWRKEVDQLPK
jgi:hypothetical protein